MRYLKLEILPETDDDIDPIVNALRTTIEREPIVDVNGDSFTLIESDKELIDEAHCLGMCYKELEDQGFEVPFLIEVVELDEPPVGI